MIYETPDASAPLTQVHNHHAIPRTLGSTFCNHLLTNRVAGAFWNEAIIAATGYTEGKVDDIEYDALVGMDHNDPNVVALFEDQLRIVTTTSDSFGLGGDSGSAVVYRTEQSVVGLHFAGPPSGMYGVANKIQHVLTELEIGIP